MTYDPSVPTCLVVGDLNRKGLQFLQNNPHLTCTHHRASTLHFANEDFSLGLILVLVIGFCLFFHLAHLTILLIAATNTFVCHYSLHSPFVRIMFVEVCFIYEMPFVSNVSFFLVLIKLNHFVFS